MLYVRVYYAPFTDSAPIRSPICIHTRRSARNRMNLNHSASSATEVPADYNVIHMQKYNIVIIT